MSNDIADYWSCSIENYTIPIVCGCDCEDLELIPEIWNTCGRELVSYIPNFEITQNTCEDYMETFGFSCDFSDVSELISYVNELIIRVDVL